MLPIWLSFLINGFLAAMFFSKFNAPNENIKYLKVIFTFTIIFTVFLPFINNN